MGKQRWYQFWRTLLFCWCIGISSVAQPVQLQAAPAPTYVEPDPDNGVYGACSAMSDPAIVCVESVSYYAGTAKKTLTYMDDPADSSQKVWMPSSGATATTPKLDVTFDSGIEDAYGTSYRLNILDLNDINRSNTAFEVVIKGHKIPLFVAGAFAKSVITPLTPVSGADRFSIRANPASICFDDDPTDALPPYDCTASWEATWAIDADLLAGHDQNGDGTNEYLLSAPCIDVLDGNDSGTGRQIIVFESDVQSLRVQSLGSPDYAAFKYRVDALADVNQMVTLIAKVPHALMRNPACDWGLIYPIESAPRQVRFMFGELYLNCDGYEGSCESVFYDLNTFAQVTPSHFYIAQRWQVNADVLGSRTPLDVHIYTSREDPDSMMANFQACNSYTSTGVCIESIRYTTDAVVTDKSKFTPMTYGYLPCTTQEIADWCDETFENTEHCDPLNMGSCKPIRTDGSMYWNPEKRTATSPYLTTEFTNNEDSTHGIFRQLILADNWIPAGDEETFSSRNDYIYEVIIRGDPIPIYNHLDMRDYQLKPLPSDNGIPRYSVSGRHRLECTYDYWCDSFWQHISITDDALLRGIDVDFDGTVDTSLLSSQCIAKLQTAPRSPIIFIPNVTSFFVDTLEATPGFIQYGVGTWMSNRVIFNGLFPHAYWQGEQCGWNMTYTVPTGTTVQPFTALDATLERETFDPDTGESTGFITRTLGLKSSVTSAGIAINLGWTVSITEDFEFMSFKVFAKQNGAKSGQSLTWPNETKYKNPVTDMREGNSLALPTSSDQSLPITWSVVTNDLCTITNNSLKVIDPGYCEITATNLGSVSFYPLSETITVEIVPKEEQTASFPIEILGLSTVTFPLKTNLGGALSYTSLTTDVCTVAGNLVTGVAEGSCVLEVTAPETATGTNYFNELTVTVLPRQALNLDFFFPPTSIIDGEIINVPDATYGKKLTWTSDTPELCTFNGFKLTANNPGECAYTGEFAGDTEYEPFSASYIVTVDPKDPQTLTANFTSMVGMNTQPLPQKTDQNTKVNWFSLSPTVCIITGTSVKGVDSSNSVDIRECALRANATEITTHDVFSDTYVFDVEPRGEQSFIYSTDPITEGLKFNVPANTTENVPLTWTSLSTGVCTVSKLAITTVNAGDCELRASNLGTKDLLGYSEDFIITVLPLPEQSLPASPVIPTSLKGAATGSLPGKTQQNSTIMWTSSTTGICTVSGTQVKAVSEGTCTLNAGAPKVVGKFTVFSDSVDIDILEGDPQTLSTTPSLPVSLVAYGSAALPTTTQQGATVTWISTTTNRCTVSSSKGALTVVGANGNVDSQTCTIRATAPGINTFKAYQEDFNVTVLPRVAQSLTVNIANLKGSNSRALPTTTTVGSMSVTWSSTSSDSCTLSKNVVFGKAAGTCTVVASALGSLTHLPFNQSYDITIDPKDAQSLTVNTDNLKGTNTRALPTTTTTGSMPVTWSSSSTAVCKLTGNTIQGVAPGTCVVVANASSNNSFQSFTQSYNITIEGKDPQSLTVNTDNLKGTNTRALPTTTTTGSMPVTWSSTTTTFCKLTGNTLQGVAPGTCVVVANALGNNSYQSFAQSYSITIDPKDAQGISYSGTTTITGTQTLNLPPVTTPGNKTIVWKTTSASCTVTGNVVTGKAPATQSSCTVVGSALGDANWADLQAAAATLNILVKPRVAQTLIATPPATLAKLATTSLASNTAQGLAIVWKSNTTTICVVSGSTLTILNKSGTCKISASNTGNSVYAALSRNYNITVP